ncbi:MAG: hypothetical protein HKN57_04205 [Xanthomonadales bacterium]|nr:hypothetical protein [Gammaproteobacteria bacterium]MBT8054403.1 hypothetical protein [Gammaproteobacteria bacterium]NND56433.1 hypothetical protein [Xanthomonadales bacterium]NNK51128.1 hypothetical protein [Xanthomonadales bacterium]
MASNDRDECNRQNTGGCDAQPEVAMLRAEISFWQDLIEACPDSQSPDSIERMKQALALAEFRLAKLSTELRVWTRPFQGRPVH